MPLLIDIEKDGLYQMGVKKEREKNKALLKKQQEKIYIQIAKMLDAKLNIEQIADFTMLTEKEVKVFIKKIETDKKEND